MLLRRVIEHVRTQNWTAILIDFAIVVMGVYLGLQVQEWGNSRADRQREVQIVIDLLGDLEIDRGEYQSGMLSAQRRVSAANASLIGAGLPPVDFDWNMPSNVLAPYSFDKTSIEEIPATRQDMLWTDLIMGFFPDASTATFDGIVGAGDTKVIRDRNLVRALQTYYARVRNVRQQNEKFIAIRADMLEVGVSYGLAPYATIPAKDYFRLVKDEPELAAAIRVQATMAIFHRGDIESADTHAAELQDRLKDYLEHVR